MSNNSDEREKKFNEELYNEICDMWKYVLNTEDVGPDDDFFEAGGNSILVSQLMFEALKRFSIPIPFHYILENSTIMGIYRFIAENKNVTEDDIKEKLKKLRAELQKCVSEDYHVKERIAECKGKGDPGNILLTGATGFLGVFILKTLLEETDSQIWLLVRASAEKAARRRVVMNMKKYMMDTELLGDRVHFVTGDIEKKNLGMDEEEYNNLSDTIGRVIHSAALVNFITPYEQMKDANVTGTVNMIMFCTHRLEKEFHFISSYAVYEAMLSQKGRITNEKTAINLEYPYINSYTYSKLISDIITDNAANDGLTAKLYRSGTISGETEHGVCQESDFFWRLVYAGVKIKAFPFLSTIGYNLIPADVVAKAVVRIMNLPYEQENNKFNLAYTKIYTEELIGWIGRLEPDVKKVPFREWYKDAVAYAEKSRDRTLLSILAIFPTAEVIETFVEHEMDLSYTESILRNIGADYRMNYEDFEKSYNYFMNIIGEGEKA